MLTSQNPRILIKFKDFLDGDPPLLLGMVHLFCTVPNFLQAVPTRDTKKPAGSLQDPGGVLSQVAGISDSTVQLYFYDIGNIGDHIRGVLFPTGCRNCRMISDSTVQLYFYDIGNIDLRIWDSRIEFHHTGTAAAACWQSLSDCRKNIIIYRPYSTVRQYSTAV